MSEERQILLRTASTIFEEITSHQQFVAAEEGKWISEGWQLIEESGLDLALAPDGFDLSDALAIVRCAGSFALPLPLVETMIAKRVLLETGFDIPDGVITFAAGTNQLAVKKENRTWHVAGELTRVPWGRFADYILTTTEEAALLLPKEAMQVAPGANLAGEARDTMVIDSIIQSEAVRVSDEPLSWPLQLAGAAVRSIQIAGALERMLEMTVMYANERAQFGRSISKFQVIQHYVAILAGHIAAAGAAADIAVDALNSQAKTLPIAIAKSRASEAVGASCALAHQVHGAMGVTHEHSLQLYTRRLWSWRDEFGSESAWNSVISREFTDQGADGFWPQIVSL